MDDYDGMTNDELVLAITTTGQALHDCAARLEEVSAQRDAEIENLRNKRKELGDYVRSMSAALGTRVGALVKSTGIADAAAAATTNLNSAAPATPWYPVRQPAS